MSTFQEKLVETINKRNAEIRRKQEAFDKMLDYKSTVGKYCNGYVGISFRTDKPEYDINKNNFILNSKFDGWFRKDSYAGVADGYGLMIRNIKITSRKPVLVGDFICHKAEIIYESNDFESSLVIDKFWVFVHKEFDIADVVEYIDSHINEWQP